MEPITNLPPIIMPGEATIQQAASRINNKFPGFFNKIKEIRVAPGNTGYGFVNNKEMGVVFIDFNKIKSTVEGRMGTASAEEKKKALILALAETISHEVSHIEKGLEKGEFPAEEGARQVMQQLNNACDVYIDMIKKYC